jgi:hypothetical protein
MLHVAFYATEEEEGRNMKKQTFTQKLLLAWICSLVFIGLFASLAQRVVAASDYVPIKWGIIVFGNFDYYKHPPRQNAIQKAEHWVQSEGVPYDIIEDDGIEAPTDSPAPGKHPLQYTNGRIRYGAFVIIMNYYTDTSAQNVNYICWAVGNGTNVVIFGMAGKYVPELLGVSANDVSYFADYGITSVNCTILETFSDGNIEYQEGTIETINLAYYVHANLSDTEGKTVYYTMQSNTGKDWTGMVETTCGSAKVFWNTLLTSYDRFCWYGNFKDFWEIRNLKFVGHTINFMFKQVKMVDLSIQGYKKWGGAVTYRLDQDTRFGIEQPNETAMQKGWYYDVVVCALGYLTYGGSLTGGMPDGYCGAPSPTVKHGDFTYLIEDLDPLTYTSRKFLVYNSTEGGDYDRIKLDYNENQDFGDDAEFQMWENQTHASVKGTYYWCYINDWANPTSVKLGWWCPLRERRSDFSWWKTQGQEGYLAYGFHNWQHQRCGNDSVNSNYACWNGSHFLLNETWIQQKFTEARDEMAYCLGSSGYGFEADKVLVSHAGNECPTEVDNALFNLNWVELTYGDNGKNEPSWFLYNDRKDAMSCGGGEIRLNDVSCIEAVKDGVKTLWPIFGVYAHNFGHYNLTYDVYPPNITYTDMFRFVHLDESYKFYTNKRYMLINTDEAYYENDKLILEYKANSTLEDYVWKFPIEHNGKYLNAFSDNCSIGKMKHFDGTYAYVEFSQGQGGQRLEATYGTNPCIYETSNIDEITQTFSNNKFTLIISGQSGVTSTTKVYSSDKGEPKEVYVANGTLTWSYNTTTKILTLNVSHYSPTRIVVYWSFPGDIDVDGDVDSDDLYIFAGAYGTNPPSNPDCDINQDGVVHVDDLYILSRDYGKTDARA